MNKWIEMGPGILRRTLASGESLMQMEVTFAAGSSLPIHMHQNEQMTHVVSGRLTMTLDGAPHECGPGETLTIPAGVPHDVQAREDTVALDTFSPPRFDLLAQDEQQTREQQKTDA